MKKLHIGLDFDGVIANSHPLKVVVAKKKFGVDVLPENFRRGLVVSQKILTLEQYIQVGAEAMGGSHPIPTVPDVLTYIKILKDHGYLLRVITSRTEEMLRVAERWLVEYRVAIPMQGVGYGIPKTRACVGLDVYVDDDLEKLTPLIGTVPHLLFLTWPWNLHENAPKGIIRVNSWWEIYHYIRNEI